MSIDFHHLGLTIAYETDVREFYQDILGLDIQREFVLEKEMAERIFHRNRDVKIVAGMIGDMYMELFLDSEGSRVVWEHVCLVVDDRAALIEKCRAKDYQVTIVQRESSELVFIRDCSGNIIEIKEV